ncbi:hypothetical protein AcW1_009947 [Taiwanofungus camphoratus]|nr:hypothetical protein AcW1_009947 [Antrodia cinnamomea]
MTRSEANRHRSRYSTDKALTINNFAARERNFEVGCNIFMYSASFGSSVSFFSSWPSYRPSPYVYHLIHPESVAASSHLLYTQFWDTLVEQAMSLRYPNTLNNFQPTEDEAWEKLEGKYSAMMVSKSCSVAESKSVLFKCGL